MRRALTILALLSLVPLPPRLDGQVRPVGAIEKKVDSLLAKMTLEEKVGQLVLQSFRSVSSEDSTTVAPEIAQSIREGRLGGILNAAGAQLCAGLQRIAVEESRLKIPLIFGLDVVHGFRTVFPIPLAEACTWDPDLIRKASRAAAVEASAAGVHWTYAPMVDIARDPRWGRIAEGSGEDPYLGSRLAAARVEGFQGKDLSRGGTLVACPKHFAAYGGAEGGRDYNTVDISERTLREVYLPPFEAAVRAGAGSIMCSFNEIAGLPSSSNRRLLTDILRGEWGFAGFVVSDWGSVAELRQHGVAADLKEAADLALTAGVDMDMEGNAYGQHLADLVRSGRIPPPVLDEAVRRLLRVKFALGLFDDPSHGSSTSAENANILTSSHRALAREVAQKSIVLLKNDKRVLPLRKDLQTLAVIGPLADDRESILGPWDAAGRSEDAVSVLDGIRHAVGAGTRLLYAQGCELTEGATEISSAAVTIAKQAEAVVLVVGETSSMSGEAASRAFLTLPGPQQQLFDALEGLGKPLVVVLMNGRPLAIPDIGARATAILETWFGGVEGGNAVADILFGDVNPSGKLPVTFPLSVGQVPLYYNHKNTGRPPSASDRFTSKYIDLPHTPLYPFGFGLSYTTFVYRSLQVEPTTIGGGEPVRVSVEVENTGDRSGDEVVQLYLTDPVATLTRPVKELKQFRKVTLEPGQKQTVTFTLSPRELSMFDAELRSVVEPGTFRVMAGGNSRDLLSAEFVVRAK